MSAEPEAAPAPLGIYLHVPFCAVRCSYCDFYLVTGRDRPIGAYLAAIVAEIEAAGGALGVRGVDTLHFGGGTPSLLPPQALGTILAALRRGFRVDPGAEIALEANPEDLDPGSLEAIAALGFNRIAVGVQSLRDGRLRDLRRGHDAARAVAAIRAARRSRIRSLAADLILGLPGQEASVAIEGTRRLVDLGVDHLSLYLLEIHGRTRLGREVALGRAIPADDDQAARQYEEAADLLAARGFEHYEISNFARPGHRSRHNLKYWTDAEYLGLGPSAHSYLGGRRWSNPPDLRDYLARGGRNLEVVEDVPPPEGRAAEALFTGLRLLEGVDLAVLRRRYGASLPRPDRPPLLDLAEAGFLVIDGERVRLTRRGRLVSNEIFERLWPAQFR